MGGMASVVAVPKALLMSVGLCGLHFICFIHVYICMHLLKCSFWLLKYWTDKAASM